MHRLKPGKMWCCAEVDAGPVEDITVDGQQVLSSGQEVEPLRLEEGVLASFQVAA